VNEQIAYLRSGVIGFLVDECAQLFLRHEDEILSGAFAGTLVERISPVAATAYQTCSRFAWQHIYRSKEVLDVELAGYRIIGFCWRFYKSDTNPDHAYSRLLLNRIPEQYETDSPCMYGKIQSLVDYVSGMTDVYALDLYRKITGMGLPVI